MDWTIRLLLVAVTLFISCSAHPNGVLPSTVIAESETAKEPEAETNEAISVSATLEGSNDDAAATKDATNVETDEFKPPTKEGGTENPDDGVQVDGQGRCGGGRGWYGGGIPWFGFPGFPGGIGGFPGGFPGGAAGLPGGTTGLPGGTTGVAGGRAGLYGAGNWGYYPFIG